MSTAFQTNTSALRRDLHDLCQPLTRLQWRLELGRYSDHPDELRETIESAVADSLELMECVRRIRATIETATTTARGRAA
jgi:hypothetical protein